MTINNTREIDMNAERRHYLINNLRGLARGFHSDLSIADAAADELERLADIIAETTQDLSAVSALLDIKVPMTKAQAD